MGKKIYIRDVLEFIKTIEGNFVFQGNEDEFITGFSSLLNYKKNNITWIKNAQSIPNNLKFPIKVAVIQESEKIEDKIEIENKIYCESSKKVFFSLIDELFADEEKKQNPIGFGTYISPKVKIGDNVIIGHNCTLDGDISIGDNTHIYNNVNIINRVSIGKNCEIQSGSNIGHDGFGFTENNQGEKVMIRHYGGVEIGDNVYIGGNCYIERGTLDNTVIADGVKIDGMCTIGHNSTLAKNVSLVAGSILFGSVKIGSGTHIASGLIKNHTYIGKNALIGMGSVVLEDVKKGTVVVGVPARKIKK